LTGWHRLGWNGAGLGGTFRLTRCRELEEKFPNLRKAGYSVKSPKSSFYNCVAFAMHDTSRYWWPDPPRQYFWPDAARDASLNGFVLTFRSLGYEHCISYYQESGYEKIAIYANERGEPKHVARQLPSGKWVSKCGPNVDIEHTHVGLEGGPYGKATVFMKKPLRTSPAGGTSV
jgi:hypothetical protein